MSRGIIALAIVTSFATGYAIATRQWGFGWTVLAGSATVAVLTVIALLVMVRRSRGAASGLPLRIR